MSAHRTDVFDVLLFISQANDIRQISRDQLARALALAGTASANSLSNIAQRDPQQPSGLIPSTSRDSASAPALASASGTTDVQLPVISNSLFSNALSQALASSSSVTPTSEGDQALGSNENLHERYAAKLQTMREMGLFDDIINLQALAITNGDVEAAVNLVLSGTDNFN